MRNLEYGKLYETSYSTIRTIIGRMLRSEFSELVPIYGYSLNYSKTQRNYDSRLGRRKWAPDPWRDRAIVSEVSERGDPDFYCGRLT